MAPLTLAQIKMDVKRIFGDESGVQITDTDITRWANRALSEIVQQNDGLLQAVAQTSLVANQQQYSPPAGMLTIKKIRVKRDTDLSYFKIEGMTYQEFDEYIDGWKGTYYGTSPIPSVYMYFANMISVFPIPTDNVTNGMEITYSRRPASLVADGDIPDVPEEYHDAIIDFVLYQAYEMDENWEGAGNKSMQFTSALQSNRNREDTMTQATYPRITVLAEDYF